MSEHVFVHLCLSPSLILTSLHFTIQLIKFWKFSFHQNIKSNKLKKSSKEDFFTWWNMHEILNKLKIRTVQFLVKFLLENRSRVKILSKLTFFSSKILNKLKIRREIEFEAKMIRILSLFKIFELKKVSLSRILTRDRFSSRNLTRNWTVRILSLSKISCIFHHVKKSSFDDFLSLFKIPPVCCNKFFHWIHRARLN